MGARKTVEQWDAWTSEMKAKHGNGNGHGRSLEIEAMRLMPTPTAQASKHGATPDVGANAFGRNLWDIPHLLPTPTCQDASNTGGPAQMKRNTLPLNAVVMVMTDLDSTDQRLPDGSSWLGDALQMPLMPPED
jgi:hypothetical protein